MLNNTPILVTGVERSGATIIAKVLSLCGVYTGQTTPMMENTNLKALMDSYYSSQKYDINGQYPLPAIDVMDIPEQWSEEVKHRLYDNGYHGQLWMYKSSRIIQTWPLWYLDFPDAKWVFVRRKPLDIVSSCERTGYMKAFKTRSVLNSINVQDEKEGWLWWIKQHEELMKQILSTVKIDYMEIWPERMAQGDYSQVYKMLNWLGLEWNDKIISTVEPLLWKSKNKI